MDFCDDVLVLGFKTNISGSVLYHWSGDPVPLANGNYSLSGSDDVYGPLCKSIMEKSASLKALLIIRI